MENTTNAAAQHFCHISEKLRLTSAGSKGLVAGCGRGHEAMYIHRHLGTRVVGVDMNLQLSPEIKQTDEFELIKSDVLCLPFKDETFDFVFYHHVIEHVAAPEASLREIHRVLRPNGYLYIGTPNFHRIVGYLGSYTATLRQKIAWNINDYTERLRGRFRNELGAHAGFTKLELNTMLKVDFTEVEWLTDDYLWFKYGKRLPASIRQFLTRKPVMEVAAPAIYALCRK